MKLNEKAKLHAESCRFCWMCHHICPVGSATGHERSTPRARALGLSLVARGAIEAGEIAENLYECALCGACSEFCTTGWDPVLFTKDARLQLALDGLLPPAVQALVDRALTDGSIYGKTVTDDSLRAAFARHEKKTPTLLFLGSDARFAAPGEAVKAVRVLEEAGEEFTLLADEPESGAELDFLIGKAAETKEQMEKCAAALAGFEKVIFYEPLDAEAARRLWGEAGVEKDFDAVTFPAHLAALLKEGKLKIEKKDRTVAFQDPFALARDLDETEDAREVIRAAAELKEMYLNRRETVWAGGPLMAAYLPETVKKIAARRIKNAESLGIPAIVTASPAENAALKSAAQTKVEILSLEDLILG